MSNQYEKTLLENGLTSDQIQAARKYLKNNNITLITFNYWLWNTMEIEARHRMVLLDWAIQDLEGFIKVE